MDLAVDHHTHLAPGADDGSRGPTETIAMARGLHALGVRRVHVTPHQFRFGLEFGATELRAHADGVRRLLDRAGVPLEVVAGAEYAYGERFLRALESGEELVSSEGLLLVELPLDRPVAGVRQTARAIRRRGLQPVLAHPERYANVPRERLLAWRDAGWTFQLDLPSLTGAHGPAARERARALRDSCALAGSDLHRPAGLEAVRRAHAILAEAVR